MATGNRKIEKMADEKAVMDPQDWEKIDDEGGNPFLTLRELLRHGHNVSVATLATAVEQYGVFSWDEYGRFRRFGSETEEGRRALRLLALVYKSDGEPWKYNEGYEQHPLDEDEGPDNPFCSFGWAFNSIPDFGTISAGQCDERPRQSGADTKLRDSTLVIIAALCKKASINTDIKVRGEAVKVVKLVETLGARMDVDTIKRVFKDIPEAIIRRS